MDIQKYICKIFVKHYLISNPIRESVSVADGIRHSGLPNASLFNPPGLLAPLLGVFKDPVLKYLESVNIKRARNDLRFTQGMEPLKQEITLSSDLLIRVEKLSFWTNLHFCQR